MKMSVLIGTAFAMGLGMMISIAQADPPNPDQRIAPAWEQGRIYKFGELVSYDDHVFKAKSGSAHKRPDVASEDGWEVMNECGDKSKDAIRCASGNQAETVNSTGAAQQEFERAKQDMQKGKPANQPEG